MWKYKLFIVLTFLCARAISFEFFDGEDVGPEMYSEEYYKEMYGEENYKEMYGKENDNILPKVFDAVINGTKTALESVLLPNLNTTGIQNDIKSTKCVGDGLLDFIQCVVASKIESFRQDLSEVAFPDTHLGVFQHKFDSKIQGSLEEWIKKFIKDMVPDKNCTSDE